MPTGWMDEATWRERQADERARMSRQLWGRDYPLPDIPGGAVGPDEWMNPGRNELGYAGGYPVWDRKESIQSRAEQIMVENPGVYSPQMAIEMAEKEVPRYSRSEQRIVDMERYFRQQGMDPDAARERAVMEEEDAWRNRGKAARSAGPARPREFSPAIKLQDAQARLKDFLDNPPRVRPDVLKMHEEVLRKAVADAYRETTADVSSDGAPRYQQPRQPAAPGRNEGASLPLPVDGEVPFDGMPPVSEGLDEARVQEVAGDLVSQGIPRDEAWSRAQVMLMRGPGRGGVPAKAPPPRQPAGEDEQMWAGYKAFDGADVKRVRALATHLVRTRNMGLDDAWQQALVAESRQTREGTTITQAEVDSRLKGGRGRVGEYRNHTVPGPSGFDGVPSRVSREMSETEAYDYDYRAEPGSVPNGMATEGYAEYSQRDRDMARRGYVPVPMPNGKVSYLVKAEHPDSPVGSDGRPGSRPDLVARGYAPQMATDISGQRVMVYQVTPESAESAFKTVPQGFQGHAAGTPQARRLRIKAIAEQGGIPYDQAEKMVREAEGQDGAVAGSHATFEPLRTLAQGNRDRDRLERVKAARQAAMLAGGQPTSGPGGTRAFSAGLGMLPNDWQNQVMANRLSGGDIGGATPNDVRANELRLGNKLVNAEALAGGLGGDAAAQAAAIRQEARMQSMRQAAGAAYTATFNMTGESREKRARDALRRAGATAIEADAIMNDLTAGEPATAAAQPASPFPAAPSSGPRGPMPAPWY